MDIVSKVMWVSRGRLNDLLHPLSPRLCVSATVLPCGSVGPPVTYSLRSSETGRFRVKRNAFVSTKSVGWMAEKNGEVS